MKEPEVVDAYKETVFSRKLGSMSTHRNCDRMQQSPGKRKPNTSKHGGEDVNKKWIKVLSAKSDNQS